MDESDRKSQSSLPPEEWDRASLSITKRPDGIDMKESRGYALTDLVGIYLVPVFGLAALALILFGIKLFVIGAYGNATPYWDQWSGEAVKLYTPFLADSLGWAQLLAPHCEHRILAPRLLAIGLLSANGVWNPLLQMVVNAALHVSLICLLAVMLTQVVGRRFLPAILAFCLMLFSWPYGWENTLTGFQSCFYFVLLFSIGSIWMVIDSAPFTPRWWAGTGLAVGGFFSLASGVFAPAALAAVGAIQYLLGTRTSRLHLAAVLVLGGLFILGLALTPTVAIHAPLKASTLAELFRSWNGVMGWPIKATILGPVFRNAPAVLFAATMLRTRPPADDRRWFLLTLVLWMFGQGSVIAYGRADGPVSSRYMDLFAIDVLTNFSCLLLIANERADTRRWAVPAAAVWTAVVLGYLGADVHKHCGRSLQQRLETARFQESNTRNYVCTGDIRHLNDKPYLHIPYPKPDHLAVVLDNPAVRTILPKNIGAPMQGSIIESGQDDVGIVDGYGPEVPIPLARAWGTHGTEGLATIGTASIVFPAAHRGHRVVIPVAGHPRAEGMSLELEQDGKRWPLLVVGDGSETWGVATAKVRGRPFTLHITDASPDAWLAVGSPVAVGRLDDRVERLLSRWDVFVITGSVMAVALVTLVRLEPVEPVL